MSYTSINFKTKKALKEHLQEYLDGESSNSQIKRAPIRCFQPGLGPDLTNHTGKVTLEGPHYPASHTWYAQGEMKDGILIKVS